MTRHGRVVRHGRVTRREFVADVVRAGALAATCPLSACVRSDSPAGSRGVTEAPPPPLTNPVLRAWADGMVWVAPPAERRPVAYVSMAERRVYVDHDHRDRAAWLLDAHISVSTALWRIPLPGDPAGEPITPGDPLREFEELQMSRWDPGMAPTMDDIRIVRGAGAARRVEIDCLPLIDAPVGGAATPEEEVDAWVRADPFDVGVATGTDDATRQDFMILGTGTRHGDRVCARSPEVVQLVGWSIRSA